MKGPSAAVLLKDKKIDSLRSFQKFGFKFLLIVNEIAV